MKVCLKNRTENSVNNEYKTVARNLTRIFFVRGGKILFNIMVKLSMYNEMTTVCELERVSAQPMKSQDYRQNQLCSLNKINPDQNIDCGVSRSQRYNIR
jgi:hypothetical protein